MDGLVLGGQSLGQSFSSSPSCGQERPCDPLRAGDRQAGMVNDPFLADCARGNMAGRWLAAWPPSKQPRVADDSMGPGGGLSGASKTLLNARRELT